MTIYSVPRTRTGLRRTDLNLAVLKKQGLLSAAQRMLRGLDHLTVSERTGVPLATMRACLFDSDK